MWGRISGRDEDRRLDAYRADLAAKRAARKVRIEAVTASGRYRDAIHVDDVTVVCVECGCLVVEPETHNHWHVK